MDKLGKFIKENQTILIIGLIIVIIFWFFVLPHIRESDVPPGVETFEASLDKLLDNRIRLYTMIKDKNGIMSKKYVGLSPTSECNNLVGLTTLEKDKECSKNVAILQDSPNNYSNFILSKGLSKRHNSYTLRSVITDMDPKKAYMDQSKFFWNKSNKLCFDQSSGLEFIHFQLDKTNDGYYIKFIKPAADQEGLEYVYISRCNSGCQQGAKLFDRLCLSKIPSEYLTFNFEIIQEPKNETILSTESFDPSLGSLQDLLSLGSSNGSYDSKGSNAHSIEGAMENFDSNGTCATNSGLWK